MHADKSEKTKEKTKKGVPPFAKGGRGDLALLLNIEGGALKANPPKSPFAKGDLKPKENCPVGEGSAITHFLAFDSLGSSSRGCLAAL
jgi:hypothetical protein